MNKVFKFKRVWSSKSVRECCIKYDWYTLGDNESYHKMLRFVETNKPTDRNITKIAEDIFNHSEEGREAKEWLSDRQQMIADILSDGTSLIYAEGFEGMPVEDKLTKAFLKYPSDTVLRWVEEIIDEVMEG